MLIRTQTAPHDDVAQLGRSCSWGIRRAMTKPLAQLDALDGTKTLNKHAESSTDCGVCGDFRAVRRTRFTNTKNTSNGNASEDDAERLRAAARAAADARSTHATTPTQTGQGVGSTVADVEDPYEPLACPPDGAELGQAGWTLLHTTAAHFPDAPSVAQQQAMRQLISSVGVLYPCGTCAAHLRREIAERPPPVANANVLSKWLCAVHNDVNRRQGKPEFDCNKVIQRWRTGRPGDGCFPS